MTTETPIDWLKLQEKFRQDINPKDLAAFALGLSVSVKSLTALLIGRDCDGIAWTFPERNAEGEIIGISKRPDTGKKHMVKGSQRGLTLAWPLNKYAATSADDPILIVEGATDTAAGMDLGFAAIGRPSATGGVDYLAVLLRDLHVVVVGENDKGAGKLGADKTAQGLVGVAKSVKIIYPPENVKDLRSWKNAVGGCDRDVVLEAISAAAIVEKQTAAQSKPNTTGQRPDRDPPQSERLVQLALDLYRIGRTESDEPFAVAKEGSGVALMFRGSRDALRSTLSRQYRKTYGSICNASALADAMTALQGEALEAEPEVVHLRVAGHGDGVVLDLGTVCGKAVQVKPGTWEVLDRSPVLFRRTALTGALPIPNRGGDVSALRDLVNLNDDMWALVRGWLVAAFLPDIPHPILMLGGEQGVGKTTLARMLVCLFDPSPAPLRSQPRDPESWAMAASGSWGVVVDNVSAIKDWWSDALCKAVTGDGWVRRRLYSDSDLSVLAFRRVVALTSIDAGALRGDLGDRLLLVDLDRIDDADRRAERELDQQYIELRPAILGGLLDMLAGVLARLPGVDITMPRMADFARVLAALDGPDGSDGRALPIYLGQGGRIAQEVVESDIVGQAVEKFMDKKNNWDGTASELLAAITPEKPPKDWPTTGRGMAGSIKRLTPALRAIGFDVDYNRDSSSSRARIYTIYRRVAQSTVRTVRPTEIGPGDIKNAGASPDGSDGSGRSNVTNRPAQNRIDGLQTHFSDGPDDSDGSIPPQSIKPDERPGRQVVEL